MDGAMPGHEAQYQASQANQPSQPPPQHLQTQPQQSAYQQPNDGVQIYDADAPVPLRQLRPQSQKIECPNCKQVAETRCEKTGTKYKLWLNICCWPLPNRTHWLEWNHWFCKNCDVEVAKQKYGKQIDILVGEGATQTPEKK